VARDPRKTIVLDTNIFIYAQDYAQQGHQDGEIAAEVRTIAESHPVFSGEAVNRIASSDIDQVVITDTIALSDAARNCDRIRQVTIAGLLAETMRRISNEESVSYLFNEDVASPGALFLP